MAQDIDWIGVAGVIVNAAILAGLGFVTTLTGLAVVGEGVHLQGALAAGALAGAVHALRYLAKIRGLG